jgi:hypothetical protein
MDAMTLYPLVDYCRGVAHVEQRNLRARWTGEKRPPRQGEWYLSGSIVEAYRAPGDLSMVFHIAEIVLTETVTTQRIVRRVA